MTVQHTDNQLELNLEPGAGPGAEDGPWALGWVRRLPPAVLADNLERVVDYVAKLNVAAYGERDQSIADEAWRELPEHLREAIVEHEAAIERHYG